MSLSEWDARLEIGHTKIDEQHIALADAINRLHAAMLEGLGREAIEPILLGLARDTEAHFRLEEELMAEYQFTESVPHQEIHQDLLQQLADLLKGYQSGTIALTPTMIEFLSEWLTRHIQTEDLRLVKFLRQHHGPSS